MSSVYSIYTVSTVLVLKTPQSRYRLLVLVETTRLFLVHGGEDFKQNSQQNIFLHNKKGRFPKIQLFHLVYPLGAEASASGYWLLSPEKGTLLWGRIVLGWYKQCFSGKTRVVSMSYKMSLKGEICGSFWVEKITCDQMDVFQKTAMAFPKFLSLHFSLR